MTNIVLGHKSRWLKRSGIWKQEMINESTESKARKGGGDTNRVCKWILKVALNAVTNGFTKTNEDKFLDLERHKWDVEKPKFDMRNEEKNDENDNGTILPETINQFALHAFLCCR